MFQQPQKKRGARRKTPEANLQTTVARVLRMSLIPPATFWFCPNGGNLSTAQAGRFKAMGLLSGVSDLHFIWMANRPCYGVIEMKAPGVGEGGLSDDQKLFRAAVLDNGHYWEWANSLERVLETLREWQVPMRRVDVLPSGVLRTK